MDYMQDLKKMLCEELEKIAEKGELSPGSLETVHTLTDTIKNLDKIEMLEDDGYSENNGRWMARGDYGAHNSYGDGSSYDDGNNYRNGSSYARRKRDRMGRYSRDDGREHMTRKLHEMMDDATSEKEREAIRQCISKIENA